jgi:uncharacterized membrane protein
VSEQTAEQIVRWAEGQDRKKGGAGMHLAPDQKQSIRLAFLEARGKMTRIQLAEQFGVNRETVGALLRGPEFDALANEMRDAGKRAAKARLEDHAEGFADDWINASGAAASNGNHKPAREALEAIGVVETDRGGSGITVIVGGTGRGVDIGNGPIYNTGARPVMIHMPALPAEDTV